MQTKDRRLQGEAEGKLSVEGRLEKLSKINAVLIDRVERSMDYQGNAFSLFQTAIALEAKVKTRTEELTSVLRSLEQSNADLSAAKEDAERANLSKTRFLAAAGHDLLQPVNAAMLSISTLADMQADGEGRRLAHQVERALQTIEALIKTLLDISKLDAGVIKPEVRAFSLDDLLAGVYASFDPIAAAKGLELRMRFSELLVESDPIILQRVLQNLVSNAVRYTSRGGVLIGVRRRGAVCLLDVVDTGAGIPENEQERIFDEFYRGSMSRGDEQPGLGLGLAIVQRAVNALNHRLEVRSRIGSGSRFRLTLPVAGLAPASAAFGTALTFEPAHSLNGILALIVENDQKVGQAMEQLFARWSCRTLMTPHLAGLESALAKADRLPDVVIADYHLDDGETGLTAIERLREIDPGVPALIITADYSDETAIRVRAAGCEILQKPVRPAELRALLSHVVACRKPFGTPSFSPGSSL